MKKIILLKGLPGSGKSTRAKTQIINNPGQFKRVNKDDLRDMIDCGRHSKFNEAMVLKIRDEIVKESLSNGVSVIVDDTNFHPKHEARMREIAKEFNAQVEVRFFDTPLEECIERDSKREFPVGKEVIMSMYNEYLRPKFVMKERDKNLPNCIIVDIDGTLAQKGDRDIYDDTKLHLDTVIKPVRYVSNLFYLREDIEVIIISGRGDQSAEATRKWLDDNGVGYDSVYMRKAGDNRCDTIIKKEIYEEHIKDKYNVLFVLDDRVKVVDMRRKQGLFVFDCNQEREVF